MGAAESHDREQTKPTKKSVSKSSIIAYKREFIEQMKISAKNINVDFNEVRELDRNQEKENTGTHVKAINTSHVHHVPLCANTSNLNKKSHANTSRNTNANINVDNTRNSNTDSQGNTTPKKKSNSNKDNPNNCPNLLVNNCSNKISNNNSILAQTQAQTLIQKQGNKSNIQQLSLVQNQQTNLRERKQQQEGQRLSKKGGLQKKQNNVSGVEQQVSKSRYVQKNKMLAYQCEMVMSQKTVESVPSVKMVVQGEESGVVGLQVVEKEEVLVQVIVNKSDVCCKKKNKKKIYEDPIRKQLRRVYDL